MKKILAAGALLLALSASAAHASTTACVYKLFHLEGANWIQYFPGDGFPAGGNTPGTNKWRYDYVFSNLSGPGPVNTVTMFFNSAGLHHSDFPPTAVSSPVLWTPTYTAPPSGQMSWRERFRSLLSPVPVSGSQGGYRVEFTWVDTALPGSQPYDAVFPGGSEKSVTTPSGRSTPVVEKSWGAVRKLYR